VADGIHGVHQQSLTGYALFGLPIDGLDGEVFLPKYQFDIAGVLHLVFEDHLGECVQEIVLIMEQGTTEGPHETEDVYLLHLELEAIILAVLEVDAVCLLHDRVEHA
jgi:hypothetical protein